MKPKIKLLLLAAMALPGWVNTTAQEVQPQRMVALERPQDVANSCTKIVPVPIMNTENLNTVTVAQPEERMMAKEDPCGESAMVLPSTRDAHGAAAPVFEPQPNRAEIAPIVTDEKVTRYRWVDYTKQVCQGNATNWSVPLTVAYLHYTNHGQMIYPSRTLGLAAGSKITSITFHTSSTLPDITTGNTNSKVTLSLGETTQTTYSSVGFLSANNASTIATIFVGGNTVTFVLDHPYIYQGGNLVVDVYGDGSGTTYWSDGSWYGVSQSGETAIFQYYSTGTSYRYEFLPWMTVGYQVEEEYQADAPVSGNRDFFHDIEYTWPINVAEAQRPADNKARLDAIATDPDQMIALLYEVYTNKGIPGNWKRGYDENGHTEPYDDVAYTGVGAISHTGNDYTTGYSYANTDDYGWGIPSDIVTKLDKMNSSNPTYATVYYAHMDSTQYKPNQDGLTLLLIEMRDDFTISGLNDAVTVAKLQPGYTSYDVLKARIGYAFKSVRVITESMRYGTGFDAGTMFKIDCDKMNKFFMVAKGQVRYPFNSNRIFNQSGNFITSQTFSRLPLYAYCESQNYLGDESNGHEGWLDHNHCDFLAHMFEQFSPYDLDANEEIKDVYQRMVNMESYDVPHDCVSVPDAHASNSEYYGHYFRMYGEETDISKCQDVRDLMFFVPDYRMMHFAKQTITNERSVTVAYNSDGTNMTTSAYIPVYGYYYDEELSYDQMIYPSDMLTDLGGKKIKSITFYSNGPISFGYPNAGAITAEIGTVSQSDFNNTSGSLTPSTLVTKTFTPTYGDTEMTITFDEPFTYTAGTNLLVDLTVTAAGSYDNTYWIGMTTDKSQSINYYPSSSGIYKNNFLPTMKITYEETTTEGGDRDTGNTERYTAQSIKYQNYNPAYRPSMALYVIHQDEVTCPEADKHDDYYKLTLTWDSNMDEFLPEKKQKYNLLQLVTDEFGVDKYIPVYKNNSEGQYWNPTTNSWQADTTGAEKVVLTNIPASTDKKTYTDVYVRRTAGSQQVTYAIQGCDMDEFLALQISNQQSYIIPGKDPAEMALLDEVTYYSRYNPQTQRNCYSNRLVVKSNPESILDSYFTADESNPTTIKLLRTTSAEDNNPVTVATIKVTSMPTDESNGRLLLQVYQQAPKTDYPTGESDNPVVNYAGYHANAGGEGDCEWQRSFYVRDGFVNLGALEIFDNFTVDVSENEHPAQYRYQVIFETAVEFKSLDGWTNVAYSNLYRIPVYKTDTKINALTLDQVLNDTQCDTDYSPENTTFQEQVQLSSKTEILRYDAYRWEGTNPTNFYILKNVRINDDEDRVAPTGMASNQGDGYSVSMNKQGTEDYYTTEVNVSQSNPMDWAMFVDRVPVKSESAKAFTYAPVVELFTKGVDAAGTARRADYNTYGGPQQTTAVGKMEVEVEEPSTDHPLMSIYSWYRNGNWYSYYNIYLKFTALDLPTGYELYKVRAWRKVADKSVLDEEVGTRQGRAEYDGDWYMYEDVNFGDALEVVDEGTAKTMSLAALAPGAGGGALVGDRPTSIPTPSSPDGTPGDPVFEPDTTENQNAGGATVESLIDGEVRATFGALRLKDIPPYPGSLDKLDASFKVRAYFTKNTNPLAHSASAGGSQAPRRDGETVIPGSDYDYYIAEGEVDFSSEDLEQIITSINGVKMDVNREVVEVTYVNTVGQMSRTPWQGVNIVVTRYSDGSTTTQKVIR